MTDDSMTANTEAEAFNALAQLLTVDGSSVTPLYKQLTDQIIVCIDQVRLMPGQLMPSTRELSKMLQVSRKTIMRVYDDLISQGYLTSVEGVGTFISQPLVSEVSSDGEPRQPVKLSTMAKRLLQLPSERLSCAFFPELNYGAASADMVPTHQWRRLMLAHSRDKTATETDFVNESFGYRPLREAIASYVLRKRGIHCHADQVLLFLDAMYSSYAAAQLLIDNGDSVAMEEPGYPYVRMCIQLLGAEIVPVPVNDHGMVVSELIKSDRKIDAVFVTPSHHDPLGGTMPLESRKALLNWAAKNRTVIFEDDYDNDYFYGAPPLPALMSLDKEGLVFYFANFFKVLYPLSAVGYVIVPKELTGVFAKAMTLGSNSSPARFSMHEELTMMSMLNDGILEKHIRKTQVIYGERRFQLIAALTKLLRGVVAVANVSGGMTIDVTIDSKFSEEVIVRCARTARLPLASIAPYYHGKPPANRFMISFATMKNEEIDEIVANFAGLLLDTAG